MSILSNRFSKIAGMAFVTFLFATTQAQQRSDVALVSGVSGTVTYVSSDKVQKVVQPFMRLRAGDTLTIGQGGFVKLSYLEKNQQETWQGEAQFKVVADGSQWVSGSKPNINQLPNRNVPKNLAQASQLLELSRAGAVIVRKANNLVNDPSRDKILSDAAQVYEQMRQDSPNEDVTPELYFSGVLSEYGMYKDMYAIAIEMLRRQPGNADITEYARWVGKQAAR